MTTPPTPSHAKTREDEISLSDDLKYWRAEGPDEWIMDRFIRKAEALQASETKLQAENQELRAEVERLGRIKLKWEALIGPLLDFGRDNAEHLDLRVGDCIITKALELMEEKVKKGGR